jgi:hypothetical protein
VPMGARSHVNCLRPSAARISPSEEINSVYIKSAIVPHRARKAGRSAFSHMARQSTKNLMILNHIAYGYMKC